MHFDSHYVKHQPFCGSREQLHGCRELTCTGDCWHQHSLVLRGTGSRHSQCLSESSGSIWGSCSYHIQRVSQCFCTKRTWANVCKAVKNTLYYSSTFPHMRVWQIPPLGRKNNFSSFLSLWEGQHHHVIFQRHVTTMQCKPREMQAFLLLLLL